MINGLYQPVSYAGDGAQTAFPITFEFVSSGDIRALVRVNGLDTTLTPGVDFTVSGTVLTTVTAPAVGATLIIYMEMPFTQKTDYRNTGKLNLEVLESSLDKAALTSQELRDQVGRSVKLPVGSTADPDTYLAEIRQSVLDTAASEAAAAASATAAAASQTAAAASQTAAAQSAAAAAASVSEARDAGGTANALTATLAAAPQTALADRMRLRVRAAYANTGPATLDLTLGTVDTGAVPVRKSALAPLVAGDIAGAGHELELQYNATASVWLLLNPAVPAGTAAKYNVGVAANNVLQLNASAQIPAVDGRLLTHILGQGQSWTNMTSSRSKDVTYTNTTGSPILVLVRANIVANGGVSLISVGPANTVSSPGGVSIGTVFMIVRNGDAYRLSDSAYTNSIYDWWELR